MKILRQGRWLLVVAGGPAAQPAGGSTVSQATSADAGFLMILPAKTASSLDALPQLENFVSEP